MYGILAILVAVIIYNCGDILPDSVKEWWENSTLRKWVYPVLAITLTIVVALGIQFDILNWGVIVIPVLFGFPYIFGMILGIWYNMKNAGQKVTSKNDKEAKEIAIRCLTELGCQPEVNKDGSVGVSYLGENFHLEFGGRYVRIWYPMWTGIKGKDPDMPQIKEAMNATNFNFGATVVMTAPDEDGDIGLHIRRDIMLHPACPDNVLILKAVLYSFFDTKKQLRLNFLQKNLSNNKERSSGAQWDSPNQTNNHDSKSRFNKVYPA